MSSTNISIGNSLHFSNLALFVCNLFINGSFRSLNLISTTDDDFSHHFVREIDSICSVPIVLLDYEKIPFLVSSTGAKQRNDDILQLIMLDPDRLNGKLEYLDDVASYYRVFIVSSLYIVSTKISPMLRSLEPGSKIVLHSSIKDELNAYRSETIDSSSIYVKNPTGNQTMSSYELLFGMHLKMRQLSIQSPRFISNNSYKKPELKIANRFITGFFVVQMHMSFISIYRMNIENSSTNNNIYEVHTGDHIYKEFSLTVGKVVDETIRASMEKMRNVIKLHVDSSLFGQLGEINRTDHILSLYPFYSSKIVVILVYGDDVRRESNLVWQKISRSFLFGSLFMASSIGLYVIRRKMKLNRNHFATASFDMLKIYLGYGDISGQHALENIFITATVVMNFFLISINIGYYTSSLTVAPKRVDTFEKLAKLKVPVYWSNILGHSTESAKAMLR